jgi:carboxyl-terminal processing protease
MKRLAIALTFAFVAACGSTPASPTPAPVTPVATLSPAASEYITRVMDLMQANSINRLTIDWPAFRASVLNVAGSSQTIADLTPAVRQAITLLRDGHSSYRPAAGGTVFVALRNCEPARTVPVTLPPNIGTVKVGAFNQQGDAANAFARQIQDTIAAADRDDLIGWIVDLRANGGGNMWPMIAGLGPIIGEGTLGGTKIIFF